MPHPQQQPFSHSVYKYFLNKLSSFSQIGFNYVNTDVLSFPITPTIENEGAELVERPWLDIAFNDFNYNVLRAFELSVNLNVLNINYIHVNYYLQ